MEEQIADILKQFAAEFATEAARTAGRYYEKKRKKVKSKFIQIIQDSWVKLKK